MVDLEALVEQVVSGMGFELVDFEVSPRARILRVFIDIERGVTVAYMLRLLLLKAFPRAKRVRR